MKLYTRYIVQSVELSVLFETVIFPLKKYMSTIDLVQVPPQELIFVD